MPGWASTQQGDEAIRPALSHNCAVAEHGASITSADFGNGNPNARPGAIGQAETKTNNQAEDEIGGERGAREFGQTTAEPQTKPVRWHLGGHDANLSDGKCCRCDCGGRDREDNGGFVHWPGEQCSCKERSRVASRECEAQRRRVTGQFSGWNSYNHVVYNTRARWRNRQSANAGSLE